jgi:hypothetical protein
MQIKWNGIIIVYGNWTMNLYVQVLCTELWLLYKMLKQHVLDINFPDSLQDMQRSEIPLQNHVIPAWKTSFLCIFLRASYHNSHNHMVEINYWLR